MSSDGDKSKCNIQFIEPGKTLFGGQHIELYFDAFDQEVDFFEVEEGWVFNGERVRVQLPGYGNFKRYTALELMTWSNFEVLWTGTGSNSKSCQYLRIDSAVYGKNKKTKSVVLNVANSKLQIELPADSFVLVKVT